MRPLQLFVVSFLFAGSAWADGAPLFTTAPGPKMAENAALAIARPETKSVQRVSINRDAVFANVITANIDGKEFRFVGGEAKGGAPEVRSWSGMDKDADANLILGLEGKHISGSVRFDGRYFELQTRREGDAMLEVVDTRDYSPAATAAARAAKKKGKP